MALSESFFESLVAGDQKISLASLSPKLCPFRHLEGSLAWGPSLLFNASGTYRGSPWLGFYSVVQCLQVFDGLCWQSMSLDFNMLLRLLITFLPRSTLLLISWLQSPLQ